MLKSIKFIITPVFLQMAALTIISGAPYPVFIKCSVVMMTYFNLFQRLKMDFRRNNDRFSSVKVNLLCKLRQIKQEKDLCQQHPVFPGGHPSKY